MKFYLERPPFPVKKTTLCLAGAAFESGVVITDERIGEERMKSKFNWTKMDDRSHPNIKIGALKKCIKSDVHFPISSKSTKL
jgi:hypothetical protein